MNQSALQISIIVPVFNEERALRPLIIAMRQALSAYRYEILLIDDASTDTSPSLATELAKNFAQVKFLPSEVNRGKVAAVRRGIGLATGDIVVLHDADLEYDVNDLVNLIDPILSDQCDITFGSRYRHSGTVHRSVHRMLNGLVTIASNFASGVWLSDCACATRAFRREILNAFELRTRGFSLEVELVFWSAHSHARIMEVPVAYYPRLLEQGKKLRWWHGGAVLVNLAVLAWRFKFDAQTRAITEQLQSRPEYAGYPPQIYLAPVDVDKNQRAD